MFSWFCHLFTYAVHILGRTIRQYSVIQHGIEVTYKLENVYAFNTFNSVNFDTTSAWKYVQANVSLRIPFTVRM